MNLLSSLMPSLGAFKDDDRPFDELSAEEQAAVLADEKRQRVAYHRENVRNGPRQTRHFSSGRMRSIMRRAEKTAVRRQNVKHRQDWTRQRDAIATLRGQLECVTAEPRSTMYENATLGLFDVFGSTVFDAFNAPELLEQRDGEIVKIDVHNKAHRAAVVAVAVHRYKVLTGQEDEVSA